MSKISYTSTCCATKQMSLRTLDPVGRKPRFYRPQQLHTITAVGDGSKSQKLLGCLPCIYICTDTGSTCKCVLICVLWVMSETIDEFDKAGMSVWLSITVPPVSRGPQQNKTSLQVSQEGWTKHEGWRTAGEHSDSAQLQGAAISSFSRFSTYDVKTAWVPFSYGRVKRGQLQAVLTWIQINGPPRVILDHLYRIIFSNWDLILKNLLAKWVCIVLCNVRDSCKCTMVTLRETGLSSVSMTNCRCIEPLQGRFLQFKPELLEQAHIAVFTWPVFSQMAIDVCLRF